MMILVGVCLWFLYQCLYVDGHPERAVGSCFCHSGTSEVVLDAPCGDQIGHVSTDECFKYKGEHLGCSLLNTKYTYYEIDFYGKRGWLAADHLNIAEDTDCVVTFQEPDEEFRSIKMATVNNIDWPKERNSTTEVQQQEMLDYLNLMQDLKMNAIMFHSRTTGDAFYNSSYEPWSVYLTGTQGTPPDPYWDPLEFVVQEAHARGIEVLAWLNPYRAKYHSNTLDDLHSSHMCLDPVLGQYCYPYDNYLWMDPGAYDVLERVVNVVIDIMEKYDVDGILMDDYFYPYPDDTDFPDDMTWERYLATCGNDCMSRDDWRRDNVNRLVYRVYDVIKERDRSVKFSISPFGLYRPGHEDGMPSPPIYGLDPYESLYADSKLWLQEGWLDFMVPQLYWEIDPPEQSYYTLLDWWLDANTANRHIYAGNAVYKLINSDWPAVEIERQVNISRDWQSRLSLGNTHFSANHFRDNSKGITDLFKERVYTQDATIPEMPWLEGKTPVAPASVKTTASGIAWESPQEADIRSWAVYRRKGHHWKLIKILGRATTSLSVAPGTYSVRAINRLSKASDPTYVVVF